MCQVGGTQPVTGDERPCGAFQNGKLDHLASLQRGRLCPLLVSH